MVGLGSGFSAVSAPEITVSELRSPGGKGSLAPAMAVAPDGAIWLSWLEPGAPGEPGSVKCAQLSGDATGSSAGPGDPAWSGARTIVSDASVAINSYDIPQIAVDGQGAGFVLWTDGRGRANTSASRDGGNTWTAPARWSTRSAEMEMFSVARLADGRLLAAWLDGRAREGGAKPQQLYARIVGDDESTDRVIDSSVCDCCQTSLAPFLDGGALLAYRNRTPDEIRDIHTARLSLGKWGNSHPVSMDRWQISGCPVNGPRVVSDGSRVAAAWYTAAESVPQVLVSYSPDAADRWLGAVRVDQGKPAGHPDVVLLRDGAVLVVWVQSDGSLWLRRISPEYTLGVLMPLAPAASVDVRSMPRAALRRDYAGGRSSAEVIVAYTGAGKSAGIRSLRVTIPEGDLVAEERNCDCAPRPEDLQGFAIHGAITGVDAKHHSVQAIHDEVPGALEAGVHVFAVTAAEFGAMRRGVRFAGRVDWRDGAWRLFAIRELGEPIPSR